MALASVCRIMMTHVLRKILHGSANTSVFPFEKETVQFFGDEKVMLCIKMIMKTIVDDIEYDTSLFLFFEFLQNAFFNFLTTHTKTNKHILVLTYKKNQSFCTKLEDDGLCDIDLIFS